MSYTKNPWESGSAGGTPISRDALRHMEDGIFDAAQDADNALTQLDNLGLAELDDVDLSSPPVGGQPLVWDAATSKWKPGAATIDASDDVDLDGIADGQTLIWDASVGMFVPGDVSGVDSINDLADVDTTTAPPTDGALLAWDAATSKWVPYTFTMPVLPKQTLVFMIPGELAAGPTGLRIFNDTSSTYTIWSVRMEVGTAPGSGSVIVDVNVGGSTIFTTASKRPQGPTTDIATDPDVTTCASGSHFSLDIDSIGTGTPPANLVVSIVVT